MSIIFTNGCFDLLHVGHFNLLTCCREYADRESTGGMVIVGLDSDEKIKKDKGLIRPFFSFEERKKQLLSMRTGIGIRHIVDKVFPFDSNEQLHDLIKTINPDLIVKGEDWKGNVVGSDIAEVSLYPINTDTSSTIISGRIVQKSLRYDFGNELRKIDPFER